ncbi:hypothetical protein GDO78_023097 [Eleutherodactylus coqui]|uniref:Taste receptor type 2 n=1 Tax=Eleutherodactylus coqui TaxID=57060 RepID=A0A8J6EG05_ELECQ|nr:hypothetical protein GDO78_023097 [Eleutherodactylus coqui]
MAFYVYYIITALLLVECAAGIIVNVFLVANNLQNWRTRKTLQTCDKILSCLATCRCFIFFFMILFSFFQLCFPWLLQNLVYTTSVMVGTMLLNYTNLWLTTILCVFYCLKIANYNHKLFLFLKTRISSLVHWLILASLIISVAFSLPTGWLVVYLDVEEIAHHSGENVNFTNITMVVKNKQNRFLLFLGGSLPPFLIFCVAIFLLIQSLWMHIRHMRCNGAGFRSPNLEVHFSAVKSMSLFLVLQVVYLACMSVLISPTDNVFDTWKLPFTIITWSPPFLHSLYIIFSNTKLKETFLRKFLCR